MRIAAILIFFLALIPPARAANAAGVLGNARELSDFIYGTNTSRRSFSFVAVVSSVQAEKGGRVVVEDASGSASVHISNVHPTAFPEPGDRIRLRGFVAHSGIGSNCATMTHMTVLSHGPPPKPIDVSIKDLNYCRPTDRLVRIQGVVLDAFRDEIDPRFLFLVITDGADSAHLASMTYEREKDRLPGLVGATVSVVGICINSQSTGSRKALSTDISIDGLSAVTVLKPAPADPFDVPTLLARSSPFKASSNNVLRRMKVRGRVAATWRRNRMIVQTGTNEFANVRLAEPQLPPCGAFVEAVGLPETDFFRWNLSRGLWREAAPLPLPDAPPSPMSAQSLLTDDEGQPKLAAHLHGMALRLVGRLAGLSAERNAVQQILLDCQGTPVAVDISSAPAVRERLERDATVEVTGVCVMETEPWSPHLPFPHAEGCFLVIRTADDIRILERPPWWTVGKMLGVVGSLLAALLACGVWNRMLKRLADRRGRQLYRERIASASSALRTEERTRLAVELHDSISQNLTGISMQIDAADRQLEKHPEKTRAHLGVASRTLDSCRAELRNCIWDLRNQALEEADMNKVLQRTLQPHLEGAGLQIRFNVPRARLSDNTAHALIRIIRELATNAVRHGKASTVRVAGTVDGNRLMFSVADDGCGFDPDDRPGMSEGHFGLQGVHERVRQLHGTVVIASAPGSGTKVTVAIPVHLGDKSHG